MLNFGAFVMDLLNMRVLVIYKTIPLPCHRRLIASTLRRSPVLHRSLGGHTCNLRRRSWDVELCDVELVIINL